MLIKGVFTARLSSEIASFHEGNDSEEALASAERMKNRAESMFPEAEAKTYVGNIGLYDSNRGVFRPYTKAGCSVSGVYTETREYRTEDQFMEESAFRRRIEEMLDSIKDGERDAYRAGTLLRITIRRKAA